jgi:hypothetical protein
MSWLFCRIGKRLVSGLAGLGRSIASNVERPDRQMVDLSISRSSARHLAGLLDFAQIVGLYFFGRSIRPKSMPFEENWRSQSDRPNHD